MEAWYTLHTKPNSEYRVVMALQQRNFETYLPEIKTAKVDQHREKHPFFPAYLFIKVDLEKTSFSKFQWIAGLRRIVSLGGQPVLVPDVVIDLIQFNLNKGEGLTAWPIVPFKPGDPIEITEGPFKGMQAIFDGPTTSAERVQVLLEILGSVSKVQVEVANLKNASPDTVKSAPKRSRRTRGQGRQIMQN